MNSPIVITPERAKNICKMGQGHECCSFLTFGAGGFCCAKGSSVEPIILKRRNEKTMTAMGDNCPGAATFN